MFQTYILDQKVQEKKNTVTFLKLFKNAMMKKMKNTKYTF